MSKALVRWAIANMPSMNILFVAVLLTGTYSAMHLHREMFPVFQLDMIEVSMVYPGAAPAEVEEGICQKLEEAVRSIDGIRKITSTAAEGVGSMTLELTTGSADPDSVLNEVRSAVDQIRSFPVLAEKPRVQRVTMRQPAIRVGVIADGEGPADPHRVRELAEQLRTGLLRQPTISQVNIVGAPEYEIHVEIPEEKLRSHGLSIRTVANIIRRENHQMPGGTLRSTSQELLLRGNNRRLTAAEIAKLPVVTQADGAVVTVADLGRVHDGFADTPMISRINGKPGLALSVQRTATEDLLAMVDDVETYLDTVSLPEGFRLTTWSNVSLPVRERLELLTRNGLMGTVLVFIVLALFLELHLAMWVALGIPFSVLAACGYLLLTGGTLNMLSSFAFLIALGVVVDDAIVVGENIYAHRQMGKTLRQAAVDGAAEVMPAVTVSVLTTVFAFVPMIFVSGTLGLFIAVLPAVIICMFLFSLGESLTILPCHLAHRTSLFVTLLNTVFYSVKWLLWPLRWLNSRLSHAIEVFVHRVYLPALAMVLSQRMIAVSAAIGVLIFSIGFVASGVTPFVIFMEEDADTIVAQLTFPAGTPVSVTERWAGHVETQLHHALSDRTSAPAVRTVHSLVGMQSGGIEFTSTAGSSASHLASVEVELVSGSERDLHSREILSAWRESVGTIPGIESVRFYASEGGPAGTAIEFLVNADATDAEHQARVVEDVKARLEEYPGVHDVRDDATPGKWELQYRVHDDAVALGVRPADLAETMRAAFFGEEVMRLQRGRHEVKLLVRYPPEERSDLSQLNEVRIRTDGGGERPLREVAEITHQRGYSVINRVDQQRAITVSAAVDQSQGNARVIVAELRESVLPGILQEYPGVTVRWEGQQEQEEESMQSLFLGFLVALLSMFVLLSFQFRSYVQPALILIIIPFGIIGAVFGHAMMGMPLTFFSVLGIVALTGVVVNDSIVLVDFINRQVAAGDSVQAAVLIAGQRRFRPVILTSITTIAGVTPLLLETSLQAQILVPMATSLAFGLCFSTVIVLFLVPVFYSLHGSLAARSIPQPAAALSPCAE